MRKTLFWALLVAALAGCSGCRNSNSPAGGATPTTSPSASAGVVDPGEPIQAQSRLPTMKLWLGAEEMVAELATSEMQVRTGMMFRTNMEANAGMLFVFPTADWRGFWMKNCVVPLSAAYIDPEGVILEIHPLQPHDTNAVVSASNRIQYVLETPQGWFERHGLRTGVVIRAESGSLRQTFFRSK